MFAVTVSKRPENQSGIEEDPENVTALAISYMYIRELHNNFTQSMAISTPMHTYTEDLKKINGK